VRVFRPLDKYVFSEFWKIFITTALGFPILVIVIDLTDQLGKYLARNIPARQIALSYLYWIPESMFMVLPAAVLFATVFSIGAFTRHSEITAAKASGISFYRLILPIFAGSALVMLLALGIGELVPITSKKRSELLEEKKFSNGSARFNFVFAGDGGRVYKVASLDVERQRMDNLEIERKGNGREYATTLLTSRTAAYNPGRGWTLSQGVLHILPDSAHDMALKFDSARDRGFSESPLELTASTPDPSNMRFKELQRYIRAQERSGAEVDELKVELALKIAIPVTCVIIVFFGAPLATSTQRGGTAYGIAISLATTVFFLMLIQLTKAVGESGAMPPYLAAWIPNLIFGLMGIVLLARART
jgi:lipopolysaccharide export system permease protein